MVDLEKTGENKALVRDFLTDIFLPGGNPGNLDKYVSRSGFTRHGRDAADGYKNFSDAVLASNRVLNYREIVLLVGQGNFVATLSRATRTEEGSIQEICQVDLCRIENGLIVEHWDNSEPVPETDVNSGKF